MTGDSEAARRNLWRFAAGLVLVLILGVAAAELVLMVGPVIERGDLGDDFLVYRQNGATFLATGQLYEAEQLAGPYVNRLGHSVFYPPNALLLFVPLSLLPLPLAALVWWGIPLAVMSAALRRLNPAPWVWVVIALLIAWPRTLGTVLFGNSDLWLAAGIAAGFVWKWPAVLLVLKPTMVPLALIGVRRRSWWIAGILLAVASLPLLPLWFDWVTAMRNIGIPVDYSLGSLPLLLVPIVGWLGNSFRDNHAADVRVRLRSSRLVRVDDEPGSIGAVQP